MNWPTNPDDPESQPAPEPDEPGLPPTPPGADAPDVEASPSVAPPAIAPRPGDAILPPPTGAPSRYPSPDATATYPQPSGAAPTGPPTVEQPMPGGYPTAPPTSGPAGAYPAPGTQAGHPSGGYPVAGTQPGHPSGGYPVPGTQPGQPSGGYPVPGAQAGYPSGGYPAPGTQAGRPSGGYPQPGTQMGYPAGGYPSGGFPPPASGGYPAGYPTPPVPPAGRKVLVGLVAVLAVGAAAFAVVNLRSGGRSGAASPQEATTQFFESLSDEDVVGMAQMVDPAEREAIMPFLEDLESELSRLEITSGIDLGNVDGLDLEVQGLQVQPVELAPGIIQVDLVDGVVTWATEPDAVPIGDALRDIIETNTGEPVSIEATADQGPIASEDEMFLVATQTDGRWHLSLAFTIAEYARRDAGSDAEMPLPAESEGVAPRGAGSPEEAVQAFVDALGTLDLERMISLLPPDEMRALQRYAPLFLADAQESMDDYREDEGFALTSEGLEFDTSSVDGGTRVVPTAGTISFETYDGGMNYSIADTCVEMTGDLGEDFEEEYGDTQVCAGDVTELGEDLTEEEREVLGQMGDIFGDMEPGIVTVQRDGAWFVDPVRSISDLTVQLFASVAPEDLREGGVLFRLFTGDVFDDDIIYDDEEDFEDDDEDEEYEDEDYGYPYDDGYIVGYDDGYLDGLETLPHDDSGSEDVPPEWEDRADEYSDGYRDGYVDGYVDGVEDS